MVSAELVDRPNFQNLLNVPLTQRTVFTVIGTNEYGCIGIDSVVGTRVICMNDYGRYGNLSGRNTRITAFVAPAVSA
ncbi:MAG: hypothetical protein IPG73_07325 [Ignavibacteria bacterium]|nr:hypothetical protein [Ignavibacteria bacterium]